MYKTLFYSLLALSTAGFAFIVARRLAPKPQTINTSDTYNQTKNDVFKLMPIDSGDVVFLGNSITEAFPVELYGSKFKNRGISGNTTEHLKNRIGAIYQSCPSKVFILIGENDIKNGVSKETLLNNYDTILMRAKYEAIVISLLPMSGDYNKWNADIKTVNTELQKLCEKYKVKYLDLHSKMVNFDSLSFDGLHINSKGYKIWMKEMEPFLN